VCGCGLDTVPVPGPAKQAVTATTAAAICGTGQVLCQLAKQQEEKLEAVNTPSPSPPEVPDPAAAHDLRTAASIAALVADTNALAYR